MSLSTKITINNISISPSSLLYEKMGAQAELAGLRAHKRSKIGAPREMSLARFLFLSQYRERVLCSLPLAVLIR